MGFLDNTRMDVKTMGIIPLTVPGTTTISGGRLDMVASHLPHARILSPEGAQFPDLFTGAEALFGDYTFDSTRRKNEIRVMAVINKYDMQAFAVQPGNNPLRTVIYRDLVTGEVSYFDIRKYSAYTNDFGYKNNLRNMVQVGDVISPDTKIYASNAEKEDGTYCLGTNANVAYVSMFETTEDCFAISESLAKRMTPLSIETRSINVDLRQYPLNLYGDDESYRIFPQLGDCVREDGILAAWRPVRPFSMITDLQANRLTKVNHLFDTKIYATPGAKVVDVDIYLDFKPNLPTRAYEQVHMYHEARLDYFQRIIDVYETSRNLPMTAKFSSLVTKAMGYLLAARRKVKGLDRNNRVQLMDKLSIIDLKIDIVLAHEVHVNKGHKVTGRDGTKGVVLVIPDEDMPVDEQGFRADVCIDPISVPKRTSIFQLYEVYINRLLKWQAMHLDQVGDVATQFKHIVSVLNDINPEYAKVVTDVHLTAAQQAAYVAECKADTIKIGIPAGMDGLNQDLITYLEEKYRTPISPITFNTTTEDGKKKVTTKNPVRIGSKYIYLLNKYPKPIAPGLGYVNQYHFPFRSKEKHDSPLGTQPIKFGEAESRMFATAVGIEPIMRMRGLYGNTRVGPQQMLRDLLDSPSPSSLDRVQIQTSALNDDNFAIRLTHHMFETCGIDVCNSLISKEQAEELFHKLNALT